MKEVFISVGKMLNEEKEPNVRQKKKMLKQQPPPIIFETTKKNSNSDTKIITNHQNECDEAFGNHNVNGSRSKENLNSFESMEEANSSASSVFSFFKLNQTTTLYILILL